MPKLETVIKPHVETSKPSSIEKLNKKKGIDKKTRQNSDKIPTKPKLKKLTAKPHRERKPSAVAVAGLIMHLRLVSGRGGSLLAEHYTRDLGNALAIADKLKAAELRPNIVRSGPSYVVYIATTDLLGLAERGGEIRRAIALYLAEKVKNGTPRQREIAEKILKRHPLFHRSICVRD
jgi:hypothetical protein